MKSNSEDICMATYNMMIYHDESSLTKGGKVNILTEMLTGEEKLQRAFIFSTDRFIMAGGWIIDKHI